MPSTSEKQRKLFGIALSHKRGENDDVSGDAKELSKLPEKTLKDYASKIEESLSTTMAHNAPNPNQYNGKIVAAGRMYSFLEWKKNISNKS